MPDGSCVRIARIYDPCQAADGYRVLVDRLWPRGARRATTRIDHWAKELAPSTSLRRWFGHERAKFEEFRRRYLEELRTNESAEAGRDAILKHPVVTLLYAASDTTNNHAVVLREFLVRRECRLS